MIELSSFEKVYTELKQKVVHGSLGAAFSGVQLMTIGQVCERIRTERQAHPDRLESVWQTIKRIYAEGGVSKFYQGITWSLITQCSKNGFRWMTIAKVDEVYMRVLPDPWKKTLPTLQSSCVALTMAFAETSLFACPSEFMKTRRMTSQTSQKARLWTIVKNEGLGVLYRGWSAVFMRYSVSWISYLSGTQKLYSLFPNSKEFSVAQELILNGCAGGINVLLISPFDTVKTQLQKENRLEANNFLQAVQKVYRLYGVRAFWRGAGIKMVNNMWYAGIMLTAMKRFGVYESNREKPKAVS